MRAIPLLVSASLGSNVRFVGFRGVVSRIIIMVRPGDQVASRAIPKREFTIPR